MPRSRKRPGHHDQHHPGPVPARQRTKGRVVWAILFAIFGIVVAFFASANNIIVLIAGALVGALVGYMIGKNMEEQMKETSKR